MNIEEQEHRERLKILEKHLDSFYAVGEFHNAISDAMKEYGELKLLGIGGVMPRNFSKEALKNAYIQGYRKRAINSELKYDEISEQYAINEFKNWFENLYEA